MPQSLKAGKFKDLLHDQRTYSTMDKNQKEQEILLIIEKKKTKTNKTNKLLYLGNFLHKPRDDTSSEGVW